MTPSRPNVEFPHWTDTAAARNEKILDVDTETGPTCRIVLVDTGTSLDVRVTDADGAVRITNGAHFLTATPAAPAPTVAMATAPDADGVRLIATARPTTRVDLGDDPDGDLDGADYPPFGAPADDVSMWDGTADVPDDVRMLRAALAAARRRAQACEPPAQAWLLNTGEPDSLDRPEPALVVIGTEQHARAHADRLNLETLRAVGQLLPHDITHVHGTAITVAFGDQRP